MWRLANGRCRFLGVETRTQRPTWVPIAPSVSTSESTEGSSRLSTLTSGFNVFSTRPPPPNSPLPPFAPIRPSVSTGEERGGGGGDGVEPTDTYGVLPAVVGRPDSNRGGGGGDFSTSATGVRTVTMRPPSLITTRVVPLPHTQRPDPSETVRQLYEHTLKAFCHWLTRLFKSLHYTTCIDNGHRAVK